jgi:hypothetical protein
MNAHDDDNDRFPPSTFTRITNTLIHASSSTSLSVFFGPWFSFSFTFGPFFFQPILSATLKRFIYDTVIHTTRPYRIDGGELARYTTPYLNFYGLVGPFTLCPTLHILLSLIAWTSKQRITHHHHQTSIVVFSTCFLLTWATSNALFFSFSAFVIITIISLLSIRRFFWTVGSPRNLYQDNFGIMSFHVIHPIPLALSSTVFATPR